MTALRISRAINQLLASTRAWWVEHPDHIGVLVELFMEVLPALFQG